jgi:hypothetical protein
MPIGANGLPEGRFVVPADAKEGPHLLVATCDSDVGSYSFEFWFQVAAAAPITATTATTAPTTATTAPTTATTAPTTATTAPTTATTAPTTATTGPTTAADEATFDPGSAAPGKVVRFTFTVDAGCRDSTDPAFVLVWEEPTREFPMALDAEGQVDETFTVPLEAKPGTHRLQASCRATGKSWSRTLRFSVIPGDTTSTTTTPGTAGPTPATIAGPAAPSTAGPTTTTIVGVTTTTPTAQSGGSGRGARSLFPRSLTSMEDVSFAPMPVLRSLALAGLLMLLIGFPAELFNKTVEEHYDELSKWFGRRGRRPHRRWPSIITLPLLAAVAAVLFALLDPGVTTDRSSLALVIGLFVAVLVTTLAFEVPAMSHARSRTGGTATLRLFPKAVAFGALCVAVSRLASFHPGYAYGIVAGYVLVRERSRLSSADAGRSVALGALSLLVVSVAAWVAWTPLDHTLDSPHRTASLAVLLPDATLAALFVMGLEGLTFALVPMRILDGGTLARWSRAAWLALWGAATFGFVHVLLDPQTGRLTHDNRGAIISMILLFAAFGTASVALWAYFRFRRPSTRANRWPPPRANRWPPPLPDRWPPPTTGELPAPK